LENINLFISIVTITFNSKDDLTTTINSVINQTFQNFEHIVIDGDSNDGTKELFYSPISKNLIFKSEKDNGIYDAMNKGIRLAKGDFVMMLNAGDIFYDNNSLESLVIKINNPNEIYYGKALVQGLYGFSFYKPSEIHLDINYVKNIPIHQSILVPKKLFGIEYDTEFKIAGDTEYLIRLFSINSPIFINVNFVKFNLGGISSIQRSNKQLYSYIIELNKVKKLLEKSTFINLLYIDTLVIFKYIFIKIFGNKIYFLLKKKI
jgi:glycosyltransferase involved in cell wall biosynthesis